ncbi:MAG: hypothetical protein QOK10_1007 [Pseudonocardiales bacterium]|jgi:hypothetical protein|nr:hypothetical protein [Pseudonocardiales bacterium]
MASTVSPRGTAPQHNWDETYPEHPVNELLAQNPGAQSPFGDDLTFPLPVASLFYEHPGPESRPHLAGD